MLMETIYVYFIWKTICFCCLYVVICFIITLSFMREYIFFSPNLKVDSDDAMGGNTSILTSPTPPAAGPYGKEIGSTPPQSPSVSTALSGAGYKTLSAKTSHFPPFKVAFIVCCVLALFLTSLFIYLFLFFFLDLHVRAVRWWGSRWTTGRGKAQRRRKREISETWGWRTPWRATSVHCKSAACPAEGNSLLPTAWPWRWSPRRRVTRKVRCGMWLTRVRFSLALNL